MKISGWGRYPETDSCQHFFHSEEEVTTQLSTHKSGIARGLGRSYGDSSLANNIYNSTQFNHFIHFDEDNGILVCESGVSLGEIIDCLLPRGWFLAVTPGTKFVTIGGAIASDVHGKNHHHDGCFSEFIHSIRLLLPDGSIASCSKTENTDLFHATCGGMGLTGIILEASIQLIPVTSSYIKQKTIKAHNLKEIFDFFEEHEKSKYSVAWLDCMATQNNIGRSLLMLGEHDTEHGLACKHKGSKSIPFDMPAFTLNKYSVKAFNFLYYNRITQQQKDDTIDLNTFFYPLDNIHHWNRLYGKNGFTQYQCVIPKESGYEGMKQILELISEHKKGSFLSVLKLLGPENANWLSFPKEGYTLALDFKMDNTLLEFLSKLDRITEEHEGRIYLTKDSRMSSEFFKKSYPHFNLFTEYREHTSANKVFNSLQSKRLGL